MDILNAERVKYTITEIVSVNFKFVQNTHEKETGKTSTILSSFNYICDLFS